MLHKRAALLAAAGTVALALAPAGRRAVGAEGDVAAQVRQAYAAWDAAFNQGDAKAVAASYADDAMLLPPTHDVIKGQAGVDKFFAGLFGAGFKNHKLELIEAWGDHDLAVAAAKWSATAGDGSAAGGIATHAFARQPDGSLKLALHTFN